MLALGIALVIVGFLLLPRGGLGGLAGDGQVEVDLQGVHSAGRPPTDRPASTGAVARGLMAFAAIVIGTVCIGFAT